MAVIALYYKRKPERKGLKISPKGVDELKDLKHQLATGKITVEEYEKAKLALEELRNLKYRLATGKITVEEYEKVKSARKE